MNEKSSRGRGLVPYQHKQRKCPSSGAPLTIDQRDRYHNFRHQIVYLDPTLLRPRENNFRTHPPQQILKLTSSIEQFGFPDPVLISADYRIVHGEARVRAALSLGLREIPTIRLDHLSPAQLRGLALALNRIPEDAKWNNSGLAIEFQELSLANEFDLTLTGFETAEIDVVIGGGGQGDADQLPDIDRTLPAVSRRGDSFRLSEHRLVCGNALNEDAYNLLLAGKKAQMIFSDPPYNVKIEGHVSGLGRHQHREFVQASGELTSQQYMGFLGQFGVQIKKASQNGAIAFVCMDWRHYYELQSAFLPIFGGPINLCVWVKTNGGMGSLWRSQHELVLVYKNGRGPHINNVQLGRFGRSRTNVWTYPGANAFGGERDKALAIHPTVKPTQLVADAILDCSNRGGVILDPFLGSGTTLIAAERTGRKGYGLELDPHYVDATVSRFQTTFGIEAIHEETGLPFTKLAQARRRLAKRKPHP